MLTIWKYPVPAEDYFKLSLPIGAMPLAVQAQRGQPQMWVLLEENETVFVNRVFRVAGTGHPIAEGLHHLQYIDTFQLHGGNLIFHVFEVPDKTPLLE